MTRAVTRQDYPPSMGQELAEIWAAIEKLFTRVASSKQAQVGESGALPIRGLLDVLGSVSLKDHQGVELVRLGDMPFGRGLEFKRENGTAALVFWKPFSETDALHLALLDINGAAVLAENSLGPGLGRPYLELPMQPYAPASGTPVTCGPYGWERTTASGSWETMFGYDGKAQNGFLDFKFAAVCSDGSTAGEIQVVDLDTGVPLAGFLIPAWVGVIPAGTTTLTVIDPTPAQVQSKVYVGGYGGAMRVGVQARVTAGAGSITLAVPQSMGG